MHPSTDELSASTTSPAPEPLPDDVTVGAPATGAAAPRACTAAPLPPQPAFQRPGPAPSCGGCAAAEGADVLLSHDEDPCGGEAWCSCAMCAVPCSNGGHEAPSPARPVNGGKESLPVAYDEVDDDDSATTPSSNCGKDFPSRDSGSFATSASDFLDRHYVVAPPAPFAYDDATPVRVWRHDPYAANVLPRDFVPAAEQRHWRATMVQPGDVLCPCPECVDYSTPDRRPFLHPAHNEPPVAAAPTLPPPSYEASRTDVVPLHPNSEFDEAVPKPTVMCCYFKLQGWCKMGDQCWYAHHGDASTPCHYGAGCKKGHKQLVRSNDAAALPVKAAAPLRGHAAKAKQLATHVQHSYRDGPYGDAPWADHDAPRPHYVHVPSRPRSSMPLEDAPDLPCPFCGQRGVVKTQHFPVFVGATRTTGVRGHCADCMRTFALTSE